MPPLRSNIAPIAMEPMYRHTSLKVGGPADLFVLPRTREEVVAALRYGREAGLPILTLGGGSNLLVADKGVEGLAIKYTAAKFEVRTDGERAVVAADAGASIAGLARRLCREGWAGLEWAVNVPGTVGGAVVNNAGAFGSSIEECLKAVELVTATGERLCLERSQLEYRYRTSRLKRREFGAVVVLRAEFEIRRGDAAALMAQIARNQELRTKTQPRQLSAGSVFANPEGDYSGRLIEQAGLKGARCGQAQISAQHANFIVNPGGATARDVLQLMQMAQQAVWNRFGVWLRPEIELVGRWAPGDRQVLESPRAPAPGGDPSP